MTVCRWIFWIFVVAYLAALTLYMIGYFGLFGQEQDPMSAVFLVPLGLPWNRLVDIFPEPLWPWLAAAAPAINAAILWFICRVIGGRRGV